MEEQSDKSGSPAGTGKTNGRHNTPEVPVELYRSPTFPPEIVDQGWNAPPDAWSPPSHLRNKVMASFDQNMQNRLSPSWVELFSRGFRIPLPLAVTTAGLVLAVGCWLFFSTPQPVVMTVSYSKPGPALVFPAPEKIESQGPPDSKPFEKMSNSHILEQTPVFRGGKGEPEPTTALLERVWLSPGTLQLEVDGVEISTSTNENSGTAFWIQAGQTGGFILTLYPTRNSGPKPRGTLNNREIQFEFDGLNYHIACERQLVTGSVALWVHHTKPLPGQTEIGLGCAPNPEQAAQILQKGSKK